MNRVYGIGLPRTGTASLAEALKKLGHTTRHFCVLHDTEEFQYDNKDIVAYIDNSFYKKYKTITKDILLNKYKDSLFILTTRDLEDWRKSMSRFHSISKDLPNVNIYEQLIKATFRSIGKENHLLIINIFEDSKCVEKICNFIGVEHQNLEFPHIKKEHEIDLDSILEKRVVLTNI